MTAISREKAVEILRGMADRLAYSTDTRTNIKAAAFNEAADAIASMPAAGQTIANPDGTHSHAGQGEPSHGGRPMTLRECMEAEDTPAEREGLGRDALRMDELERVNPIIFHRGWEGAEWELVGTERSYAGKTLREATDKMIAARSQPLEEGKE